MFDPTAIETQAAPEKTTSPYSVEIQNSFNQGEVFAIAVDLKGKRIVLESGFNHDETELVNNPPEDCPIFRAFTIDNEVFIVYDASSSEEEALPTRDEIQMHSYEEDEFGDEFYDEAWWDNIDPSPYFKDESQWDEKMVDDFLKEGFQPNLHISFSESEVRSILEALAKFFDEEFPGEYSAETIFTTHFYLPSSEEGVVQDSFKDLLSLSPK